MRFADLVSDYNKLRDQAEIRPEKADVVAIAAKTLQDLESNYDQVKSKLVGAMAMLKQMVPERPLR